MTMNSSRGYTLLEVLVVLFIISLISAVSTPNFLTWLQSYRLQAAAASLSNHLQSTRLLAILKGTPHEMQVRPATKGNYYQIVEDPKGEDRLVATIGRVILDKEFRGVVISSTTSKALMFTPRGTAKSGNIQLRNSRGETIKITISQYGRVKSEYL
ncbi:hypothetical protein CSB45_04295 [candidate division KSB3 bacterium]|uniref:General secretion pathway GspH domain-containing protein n=1 Tax=candidate division KSB3 bacterium TaxID=2044937 RepID=A0A2G6E879_9BACT|nr:MAG: hypothetical protein CSB45_04295 [candidate division KSB3 bacterium]PIE30598.1 MAG: hypothetical protein CSA57_02880 [candidate division KSB3 bacterium]